jgi:hypothetical protein
VVFSGWPVSLPGSNKLFLKGTLTMAKATLSKLIESLRGKVGDFVFREMPNGSIVVSLAPKKKQKASPGQQAYRHGVFTDRVAWAKWAYKNYPIYEELAADLPMINAYNLALKDISHPPVIHCVVRKGGRIRVHASDEIMVAGVQVTVRDEKGKRLETGDAKQVKKDWWEYVPRNKGRVTACARDLPGNKTRMELK